MIEYDLETDDEYLEDEEDIVLCDYTGDQCFGDKLFCWECPVLSPRILSFIVTPTVEEAKATFDSLMAQSLHTEIYSVIGMKDGCKYPGEIVSKTVNAYLKYINLEEYDFLLKADNDVLFPSNFLEVNCFADLDLIGEGAALLIKVKPFIEHCGGRFAENDLYDTTLYHVFMRANLNILRWKYVGSPPPVVFRKIHYSWHRQVNAGRLMFHLRVPFIRYVMSCFVEGFKRNPLLLLGVVGFVHEMVKCRFEK